MSSTIMRSHGAVVTLLLCCRGLQSGGCRRKKKHDCVPKKKSVWKKSARSANWKKPNAVKKKPRTVQLNLRDSQSSMKPRVWIWKARHCVSLRFCVPRRKPEM